MRYGMCTDIATKTRSEVEYSLLERIAEAGFDYVEFPLMMIETLDDSEFDKLLSELDRLGLACDCSCNYFPGRIKVVGPNANREEIETYLVKAMGRAARMGVKKIVFGSNNSRNLPDGEGIEQGYDELCGMLEESVVPFCRKYGITIVMEPIRRQSANFIITLSDGKKVVDRVGEPEILLLADLMHMNYNGEDPETLRDVIGVLRHVHICEWDRVLPEDGYSSFLRHCLDVLKDLNYDETISFESKDGDLKKALKQLKQEFN